ncbi:MAG: holo-ACP synthase [candidate division KSB1 bacterium]|nr:holo-ACP synthase [candidate division KSB1 bacterium]
MIYGIGIDSVDLERFERITQKWGKKFTARILTPLELEYCYQHRIKTASIAVRFAAKEAFYKCLPPDEQKDAGWHAAEILNDETGRPRLVPKGRLAETLKDRSIHISLSHSASNAVAIVIIE